MTNRKIHEPKTTTKKGGGGEAHKTKYGSQH
jgi:hypothetical protein